MPILARWLVAASVAILAGLIVAVLVLRAIGAPVGIDPSPAPSHPVSATPQASDPPSPEPSRDPGEVFAEIEAQVLELRGLDAPEIGPAEIISREQLATELEEMLDAEWTPEELEQANLALRAMGLLGSDQDLRELSEELLAGQVIGFYDPEEERMVVVSDAGLTVEARITYAHEYTHALQDAAFDTFAARDDLTDDDAIIARQALEEGDATLAMFAWALQNLTPEEQAQIGATPVPDMSGIPGWMIRQLEFPYLAGFGFVNALLETGGWEAVNAAYEDPPASSEQIIHPEKYLDGEEPVEVDPPGVTDALGPGWEDLQPTTMGQAMVDIWLSELGVDQEESAIAAEGWGGDRLTVASGPDGAWAMAWSLAWDSASDADEFAAAQEASSAPDGIRTRLVSMSQTETLLLHAPTVDILDDLVAALAP